MSEEEMETYETDEELLLSAFQALQKRKGKLTTVFASQKKYGWDNVKSEISTVNSLMLNCMNNDHKFVGNSCVWCKSIVGPDGEIIGNMSINIMRRIRQSVPIVISGAENSNKSKEKYEQVDIDLFDAYIDTVGSVKVTNKDQKNRLDEALKYCMKNKQTDAVTAKHIKSSQTDQTDQQLKAAMLEAKKAIVYNRAVSSRILDNPDKLAQLNAYAKKMGITVPDDGWKKKK